MKVFLEGKVTGETTLILIKLVLKMSTRQTPSEVIPVYSKQLLLMTSQNHLLGQIMQQWKNPGRNKSWGNEGGSF